MRAIDAEELHNALFRLGGNISLDAFTRFERLILGAPTIESVKHGKWIDDGDCFICSSCRKAFGFLSAKCVTNFCPYCGAKMDGDGE